MKASTAFETAARLAQKAEKQGKELSINHCLPIALEAASEAQRQTNASPKTRPRGQHTVTSGPSPESGRRHTQNACWQELKSEPPGTQDCSEMEPDWTGKSAQQGRPGSGRRNVAKPNLETGRELAA